MSKDEKMGGKAAKSASSARSDRGLVSAAFPRSRRSRAVWTAAGPLVDISSKPSTRERETNDRLGAWQLHRECEQVGASRGARAAPRQSSCSAVALRALPPRSPPLLRLQDVRSVPRP